MHLAELVLMVRDVPTAAAFYRDVVGLTLERPFDDAWAWFTINEPGDSERPQRLALTTGPLLFEAHSPHAPGQRFGSIHFALGVDEASLRRALRRLRDHGVDVHGPTRLEWMKATAHYFYDPDGNLVEYWTADDGPSSHAAC